MCGPLSLVLPVHHFSGAKKFLALLSYQAGRITTYSLAGLLIGIAGRRIYTSGYQQLFSISLGIVILILAVVYFLGKHTSLPHFNYLPLRKLIINLFKKARGTFGFFMLGMANGLLPCGMVYVALLTTLSFTETGESVMFMAMFGAGTLPAMMLAAYALQKLKWKNRLAVRRMVPYFITGVGILLILRGMNLGIPFISPEFPSLPGQTASCHPDQ
jgi:sulfite exporter TauE/SafE